MTDDEARALAQPHRGVWWDARGRRFVAEIYIGGQRKSLGSHLRIDDAIAAFAQADAERPLRTRKPKQGSFVQAYKQFKADCEYSDEDGAGDWPSPGQMMRYAGQDFETVSVRTYRRMGGHTVPVVEWRSDCTECGAEFECYVALDDRLARGIVRRCPDHRMARGGKRKRDRAAPVVRQTSPREPSRRAEQVPQLTEADAVAALARICDRLALSNLEMGAIEFASAAARMAPEFGTTGWIPRLRDNPQPGVVLDLAAKVVRFTD